MVVDLEFDMNSYVIMHEWWCVAFNRLECAISKEWGGGLCTRLDPFIQYDAPLAAIL